jgi:hypothetical protein
MTTFQRNLPVFTSTAENVPVRTFPGVRVPAKSLSPPSTFFVSFTIKHTFMPEM